MEDIEKTLKKVISSYGEAPPIQEEDIIVEDCIIIFTIETDEDEVEVIIEYSEGDKKVNITYGEEEKSFGIKDFENNIKEVIDSIVGEDDSEEEDDDDMPMTPNDGPIITRDKPYEIYPTEKLREMHDEMVNKVKEFLYIDDDGAKIVLRAYRWNLEKIESIFMEKLKDGVLKEVGLAPEQVDNVNKEEHNNPNDIFECPVCYDDVKYKKTSQLPSCGHRFCDKCWKRHLELKIQDGMSKRLFCMHNECHCVVTDKIVKRFVKDKKLLKKYETKVLESYVEDNNNIKWCQSSPFCGNAIILHRNYKSPFEIKCTCSKEFCFNCLDSPHLPSSCIMLTFWRKKCADDSETLNWIKAHARTCPKCGKITEKNGGCNHISCTCGTHWCWACGKQFGTDKVYNHGCNMFKEPDNLGDGEADSKSLLDRYLFYFNHYNAHLGSLKNQEKMKTSLQQKIKDMGKQKQLSAWVETQWLENALEVLLFTRRVMMNCYIFAFYLFAQHPNKKALTGCKVFKNDAERKNVKQIFELNQQDVEETTEKLNYYLDLPLEKIVKEETKREVMKLTTLNEGRAHALFDIIRKDMVVEGEYLLPECKRITLVKKF